MVQISEILQLDLPQFEQLAAAGIRIGDAVTLRREDGSIVLTSPAGTDVVLRDDVAHAFRVSPR